MSAPQDSAADALHTFAKLVARYVVEAQRTQHAGMVEQNASALGSRRHIALVRRLVTEGSPDAAIVGRRHLATREAVTGELAKVSKRTKGRKPAPRDELAEIRAKFPLERAS